MRRSLITLATGLLLLPSPARSQEATRRDHERAETMLRTIQNEVRRHYFDSTFGGTDLLAKFTWARARLDSAHSNSELFAVLAQALFTLEDSHTFLVPPARAAVVRYGWGVSMIGDSAYVIAVAPASDAWRQGVRTGDLVLAVDGYRPRRDEFWKLRYLLGGLAPRTVVTLRLQDPQGTARDVRIQAEVRELRRRIDLTGMDQGADFWDYYRRYEDAVARERDEFVEVGDSTLIWRMPGFGDEADVDYGIGRARHRPNLVLDLRGNSGGSVRTLSRMVGRILGRRTPIGFLRRRRDMDTVEARPSGDAYTGRLVVLVDSRSASAAEVFARMMQLERRGTVLGDRTMGAVRQGRVGLFEAGDAAVTAFWVLSVTDADVLMPDGHSLERVGVTPDTWILPASTDLASGRDPVLSLALQLLGHAIDPARAGHLLSRRRVELDLW